MSPRPWSQKAAAEMVVALKAIARIVDEDHQSPAARLASIRIACANVGIVAPPKASLDVGAKGRT